MLKITVANVEALSAPLPYCCQCLVTMRWWSDSQKVTFVVFFCKIGHRYMLYQQFISTASIIVIIANNTKMMTLT